jgi:hypothetical protein
MSTLVEQSTEHSELFHLKKFLVTTQSTSNRCSKIKMINSLKHMMRNDSCFSLSSEQKFCEKPECLRLARLIRGRAKYWKLSKE